MHKLKIIEMVQAVEAGKTVTLQFTNNTECTAFLNTFNSCLYRERRIAQAQMPDMNFELVTRNKTFGEDGSVKLQIKIGANPRQSTYDCIITE